MADIISRLKLESGEFDSKIKRAGQELLAYSEHCKKIGLQMGFANKDAKEFAKALGNMQTTSTTARGKINELSDAFVNLKVMYKNMTDEEKNSDFGKALSASLDQLKQRVADSKAELASVSQELNSTGQTSEQTSGILGQLASKFTINIDAVKLFNIGMQAASAALDVAKDAFFQTEGNIDEWGRTVEGAKGAYSIFLDTLNNGNWSNFFSNLSAAIQGGRDLYDVFDRLGSIKSNNAAAIALVQKEIAELRLAKQQGENVDAKLKSATERLAILQKQGVTAGMNAGNQSAFQTIRNGVNSIGGAGLNDATIKYAVQQIMKNGQAEFDKYRQNYQKLSQRGMVTKTQTIYDSQGGTYQRQYKEFDINALTTEQQKQYALAKAITDGETRIQQGISAYAQAVGEGVSSAREAFKGNRYALQGSGGGTGTTTTGSRTRKPSFMEQQQSAWDKVLRFSNTENFMEDLRGGAPAQMMSPFQMLQAQHQQELSGIRLDSRSDFEEGRQRAMSYINEREEYQKDPFKEEKKQLAVMDDIAGNIGNIMSGIQNLGIELPEGLTELISGIQSVISIISSIMSLVTLISTLQTVKATPVIGWALAGGGVIGSSRGRKFLHAAGGIVAGNTYSGDQIPAMLNAGEVVLNRAQSSTLASQLQGGGMQSAQLEAVVTGEQLRFVLNANSRRRGKGEYVTTTHQ